MAKNEVLAATAALMTSENYKDRLKAKYIQLKNRYEGLKRMTDNCDNGILSSTPTCPRATYNFKLRAMKEYLDILEIRAKIEKINLE